MNSFMVGLDLIACTSQHALCSIYWSFLFYMCVVIYDTYCLQHDKSNSPFRFINHLLQQQTLVSPKHIANQIGYSINKRQCVISFFFSNWSWPSTHHHPPLKVYLAFRCTNSLILFLLGTEILVCYICQNNNT